MPVSGVQSEYLISPIVRCDPVIAPRDACDPRFGIDSQIAPFDQFLKANRLARPDRDTFELSEIHEPKPRDPSTPTGPMATPLLPSLGEIIPTEPDPKPAAIESRPNQLHLPATGQTLDIYA